MKKILIAVVLVIVVLVAAILVLPGLVPLETLKAEIETRAREATGRSLTIGGDLRLALFPKVEVEVSDVAFANAPGASTARMATLSRLVLELELWPLLTGDIRIERFVLVDPTVHLEVDAEGRGNWALAAAEPTAKTAAGTGGGGTGPAGLRLGDVRIENGTVTYRDAAGADYRIGDINMKAALTSFDSPFEAEGSLVYNGQRLDIAAAVTTPARLAAGERAEVAVDLGGRPLKLDYRGGVTLGAVFEADGDIALSVPSVRDLADWAGAPLDLPGSGLGPLSVKGLLTANGQRFSFSGAEIALDDITASGEIAIDLAGARPAVKGRLDIAALDLNPYLPPEDATAPSAGAETAAGEGAPPDWSDEPIDLAALRSIDADLAFSTGSLAVRDIRIGRGVLTVRLVDGDLVVDLGELALYDGKGAVRIHVDARGEVPLIEKSAQLSGVQAGPLLRDAAGFDRLEGTAEAEFTISGKGRSEREIVASLDGEGAVRFTDGAIRGIDLGAMVRNVGSAFTGGAAGARKTDFAELSGSFRIANGILRNDDLRLLAPLLRIAGAGTVDLPKRRVDYRIEPKLAMTGEGQGGAADVAGIMVPVTAKGPWNDIAYAPDLAGLIENAAKSPEKLIETGKGVVEGVSNLGEGAGGGVKGVLKGLFGAGSSGQQGGGTGGSEPPLNPVDAIKGLFGGGN